MGAVERQRDLGRLCWAAEAADRNPEWSPSGSRLAQSLYINTLNPKKLLAECRSPANPPKWTGRFANGRGLGALQPGRSPKWTRVAAPQPSKRTGRFPNGQGLGALQTLQMDRAVSKWTKVGGPPTLQMDRAVSRTFPNPSRLEAASKASQMGKRRRSP